MTTHVLLVGLCLCLAAHVIEGQSFGASYPSSSNYRNFQYPNFQPNSNSGRNAFVANPNTQSRLVAGGGASLPPSMQPGERIRLTDNSNGATYEFRRLSTNEQNYVCAPGSPDWPNCSIAT